MASQIEAKGLSMDEPLLWEKGKKGKIGFSLPRHDVDNYPLDESLVRLETPLPDLSEVEVVRHYTRISQWNYGLDTGMYPLGSCTMKYNPKINEKQAALPGFAATHPLLPQELTQGGLQLMYELESFLCEITGMDFASLQPAAGAQGELAGMMIFNAYHKSRGSNRNKILIPDTAHGTNPASAALCGYKAVSVKSNENGIIDTDTVAELMDEDTAGIMITNPNTLGLFEKNIRQIAEVVHQKDALVYADGANMNAIMGIVKPGEIGVDIIHLNLHKTFSTPHGGGGPGSGPICVNQKLEQFLPVPRVKKIEDKYQLIENIPDSIGKLHAFYGNFGILVRAYSYILSMGAEGLKKVSQTAVLNANYIKESLKKLYHLPFDIPCLHECVFSDKLQRIHHVTTLDIAKRVMDYGFHPPTIYFPLIVHGAIMVEPTESESKEDIDRLIAVFKKIAEESEKEPETVKQSPQFCKRERLDEVSAAKKPCLIG